MRFSEFIEVQNLLDIDFIVGYSGFLNKRISISNFFQGQLIGQGTDGFVPKFTGQNILENSQIFTTNGSVLINSTLNSDFKLAVFGGLEKRGMFVSSNIEGAVIEALAGANNILRLRGQEGDVFTVPYLSSSVITSTRRISHPDAVNANESATLGQTQTLLNSLENFLQLQIDGKVNSSLINQVNGIAGLDAGGKIPLSLLPDSILGQVKYQGTWDVLTNTPTLVNPPAASTKGDYYVVINDGTFAGIDFNEGDWIISNGAAWEVVRNSDAVTSVFGRLGNILAVESDYEAFYPKLSEIYMNPSWIGSLEWSKITNTPTFLTENQEITLSGDVTGTGKTSIVTSITNGAVTNAKLRASAGLSVIGRESNTSGTPADIIAVTDHHVLRRSGSSIGFGTIGNASISDLAWSKITGTPTTLSGYGITNAYSTAQVDSLIATRVPNSRSITINGDTQDLSADRSWTINVSTAGLVPDSRSITINGVSQNLSIDRTWNVGTVTSVGLSLPNIFSITVATVTGSGTLTATLASQSAFTVFARGSGAGVPSFQSLVEGHLPNAISLTKLQNISGPTVLGRTSGNGSIQQLSGSDILTVTGSGNIVQGTGLSLSGTLTNRLVGSGNVTFAVNFGTTAGTVAQGNDSRIINGQTAFDWGDFRDFGLGSLGVVINSVSDFNSITRGGSFIVATSTENTPFTGLGAGLHIPYTSTGRHWQLWFNDFNNTGMQFRRYSAGSWSDVFTVWHSGNLRSDSQNDSRYVLKAGDTMTGGLDLTPTSSSPTLQPHQISLWRNGSNGVLMTMENPDGDRTVLLRSYPTGSGYQMTLTGGIDVGSSVIRGDLGVGTTSPSEALEVIGSIRASGQFVGDVGRLNIGATNVVLDQTSTGRIDLRIDNVNALTIANNRNVGIGTITPTVNLEVFSEDGSTIRAGDSAADFETTSTLILGRTGNGRNVQLRSVARRASSTNGRNRDLEIWNDLEGTLFLHSTFKFNGNLGIGTDSPSQRLQVNGNITLTDANDTLFARNIRTHSGASLYIEDSSGDRGFRLSADGVAVYNSLAVGTSNPALAPSGGIYVVTTGTPSIQVERSGSAVNSIIEHTTSNGSTFVGRGNSATAVFWGVGIANNLTIANSLIRVASDGNFFATGRVRANNGSAGSPTFSFESDTNTGMYRVGSNQIGFATNGSLRLRITSAGAMGLNVSPTNTAGRFEASNDIVAFSSSDIRLKEEITLIDSPVEKIMKLRGTRFKWIENEVVHGNKGYDYGVIAQEVEAIFPEMVQTRDTGYKAVRYEKLIPVLIEAIKAQQVEIEKLKSNGNRSK